MVKSLFLEFVEKWFAYFAGKIEKRINDNIEAGKYLHEQVLTPEYSADLKWESASIEDIVVAADVVSLDSPLPLKKRGSLGRVSQEIVKIGMKKQLNETAITRLNILKALKKGSEFILALFDDLRKCGLGIKERLESMFLEAISTGYTIVGGISGDVDEEEKGENTGTGIRVSYGFLDENKFGVEVEWGENGYKPISDIVRAMEAKHTNYQADTKVIWLSKKAYNLIRLSEEAKELAANYRGVLVLENSKLLTPTKEAFEDSVYDEYGIKFKIIDREVITEKNGKRRKIKPFDENTLVLLPQDTKLGRVVYGTLAEETNPVEGVKYQKIGAYILLSKYAKNEPLREFTSSQAFALPVIDGVEDIKLLEINTIQA